ncbi:Guanine/hypoxanthine permease GhxP [bacterium HR08]|nr:Guanine/hypoxanthine permease GhxP [bacterium HR08]
MEVATAAKSAPGAPALRFDRNEWAGAFGDLGTDFPLVVGVTLAAGLDSTSALTMFGLMQILTGLWYRLPMPVQPLKAMAALVITQKISGSVLYGAGLAIGALMLLLSISGVVDWLARIVPKSVVRGIQFGLGLQLAILALREYVQADGPRGLTLAVVGFLLTVVLLGNRKYPAALFLVLIGLAYSLTFEVPTSALVEGLGVGWPKFHVPGWSDILAGFLILALPQIPLSLGNSILATRQVLDDLFPERRITVRQIGMTYALMNLVNPFFGGIPTCHGSGGVAGHYTFGARTGGSVIIEGALYMLLGLFFGRGFDMIVKVFPLPILGVILFFEGLALMRLVRDSAASASDLTIILLVGLFAVGLPYGFLIGMLAGVALASLMKRGILTLGIREPESASVPRRS